MAGLLGFPGIEVTVVSGHGEPATFKPLNQYPDPEHKWAAEYASVQPTKRSASYLECETDAEFHIKVDINPDCKFAPASLTIRFLVDGTPICAVNLNEEVSIKEVNTIRGIISQVSAHERTITPMKFCSITKGRLVHMSDIKENCMNPLPTSNFWAGNHHPSAPSFFSPSYFNVSCFDGNEMKKV